MNVLSLFDGMSCGRIALDRLGIKVDNYYASEIDKHAQIVSEANYPDIIRLGDVTKVNGDDLPKIDLLIGGSPCQGFSFAGKQLNFDDPRSKLFWEFVRILKELRIHNPDIKFMLENVRMKKEYLAVITEALGVEPIMINSSLLSAQNRVRYYWTNIDGVEQPEDKGILLKDIVHENVDIDIMIQNFNTHPTGRGMNGNVRCVNNDKSGTLTTNKGEGQKLSFPLAEYIVPFDKTLQILDKEVERGKIDCFKKGDNKVYTIHGKQLSLPVLRVPEATKQGYVDVDVGDCVDLTFLSSKTRRGRSMKDKCNCLTAANYDYMLFGCITPDRINKRQNGQRFSEGKKFYTLTAQDKHGILVEGYIRKLTPIECERLQTVPDNFTRIGVSTHYQTCYNDLNSPKMNKSCKYVNSKNVINPSQAGRLNSAINIILDSSEKVQQNPEKLSIKVKGVSKKDVSVTVKCSMEGVLNTIKHGKENNLLSKISRVRFVVETSVQGGVACALDTLTQNGDWVTLEKLIRDPIDATSLTGMKVVNTINMKTVDGFIDMSLKKLLEENCEEVKLYTTLIWINLIIVKSIFMSVPKIQTTSLSIGSLNRLQENSLEMVLSDLKTENIIEISNSARYKMLGNGWTIDVIAHILKNLNIEPSFL